MDCGCLRLVWAPLIRRKAADDRAAVERRTTSTLLLEFDVIVRRQKDLSATATETSHMGTCTERHVLSGFDDNECSVAAFGLPDWGGAETHVHEPFAVGSSASNGDSP